MRVVCLISGGGSNLQALLDWQSKGLLGDAKIVGVISNNSRCLRPRAGKKRKHFNLGTVAP